MVWNNSQNHFRGGCYVNPYMFHDYNCDEKSCPGYGIQWNDTLTAVVIVIGVILFICFIAGYKILKKSVLSNVRINIGNKQNYNSNSYQNEQMIQPQDIIMSKVHKSNGQTVPETSKSPMSTLGEIETVYSCNQNDHY